MAEVRLQKVHQRMFKTIAKQRQTKATALLEMLVVLVEVIVIVRVVSTGLHLNEIERIVPMPLLTMPIKSIILTIVSENLFHYQ